MSPGIGSHIGVYAILAPLGKGGMGEVFRARDTRLGRLVAIKFLSAHLKDSPAAIARLEREARLASSLNHPGIVTVFDIGRVDDRPYVVMELVEGPSLAERLAEGRVRVREALETAVQVADALAAAHGADIVHRDLKPQNIMFTSEGRAKIVDFGLSKATGLRPGPEDATVPEQTITANRVVMGTAGYMAPEQVIGKAADARADQFALGAILYEMLTGRRAFRKDTAVQTMTSVLEDEPPPLAPLCPEAGPAVNAIVRRCLAKAPEERYASTRDLAHDLRDALEQAVVDSRTHASGLRAAAGRRPGWWLAAAGAGIAAAVAARVALWPGAERDPSAMGAAAPTSGLPARGSERAGVGVRRIVVLPFTNITKDPADDVLADGLVETLTASLSELERFPQALRIVPASEVRNARVSSAREARQIFGATLAITGAVQRGPASVRLTLNLVDAAALAQLASRTVDLAAAQAAVSQQAVVGAMTRLLSLELDPREREALAAGGTSVPEAYGQYVRGRGLLQRFDRGIENVDRAAALFTSAVAADPRFALAHAALGEASWRKYEIDRNARWIEQAADHCRQALALDDRHAAVHVTLAMIARGQGRFEEAVAVAQRAVELDPVSSDAYRELARAYEELKRVDDAEATYRKAVAARPDDWLAHNSLAAFYYARRRFADAERVFRQVIALTPDNTRGYNGLGATYFAMGRREEAAALFERSLAIRPTFAAASNLGAYLYSRGRYAAAARAFEQATVLAPNDYRVWLYRGQALHWAPGGREKARPAYERAAKLAEAERTVT
jgi:serine/threonine-protein kinase